MFYAFQRHQSTAYSQYCAFIPAIVVVLAQLSVVVERQLRMPSKTFFAGNSFCTCGVLYVPVDTQQYFGTAVWQVFSACLATRL